MLHHDLYASYIDSSFYTTQYLFNAFLVLYNANLIKLFFVLHYSSLIETPSCISPSSTNSSHSPKPQTQLAYTASNNKLINRQISIPNQQQQQQQQQIQQHTRNLDSMTHLVQAACVSLADVRRYKHDNFNVKYVKCSTLSSSPTASSSSTGVESVVKTQQARSQVTHNANYLTPVNVLNTNPAYLLNQVKANNYKQQHVYSSNHDNNNTNNGDETQSSISSSPPHGAPAASSTVLMPNISRSEPKSCRSNLWHFFI